jgi:hypothetical protein
MVFRYYSNAVSQATRGIAHGIGIIGLLLIGFGTLILAIPELFIVLAAGMFFLAGFGCCFTALKIFLAQKQADHMDTGTTQVYRQNVRIHDSESF